MPPTTRQKLAINYELRNATQLIRAGLGQLQEIDNASDFLHLPLLTLATGFERLLKVTLCFHHLQSNGVFPTKGELFPLGKGHNLLDFLGAVRERCFVAPYVSSIPVATTDLDFLSSEELIRFMTVLSDFGQGARYYFLDVIVDPKQKKTSDPEQAWKAIESQIVGNDIVLATAMQRFDRIEDIRRKVTAHVVTSLEKLARAIARLFTIGSISSVAKPYSVSLYDFVMLRDEQLGVTRYSPLGRASERA